MQFSLSNQTFRIFSVLETYWIGTESAYLCSDTYRDISRCNVLQGCLLAKLSSYINIEYFFCILKIKTIACLSQLYMYFLNEMKLFIKNPSLSFCLFVSKYLRAKSPVESHPKKNPYKKKKKNPKQLCTLFHDSEPLNLMSNVGKSWIMPRLLFTQDALLPARFWIKTHTC